MLHFSKGRPFSKLRPTLWGFPSMFQDPLDGPIAFCRCDSIFTGTICLLAGLCEEPEYMNPSCYLLLMQSESSLKQKPYLPLVPSNKSEAFFALSKCTDQLASLPHFTSHQIRCFTWILNYTVGFLALESIQKSAAEVQVPRKSAGRLIEQGGGQPW